MTDNLYPTTCLVCGEDNKKINKENICTQCEEEIATAQAQDIEQGRSTDRTMFGCLFVVILAAILGIINSM